MSDTEHALSPRALIVGCGYLGLCLARRLQQAGIAVFGTTRSAARASALRGSMVEPLLVDLLGNEGCAGLRPVLGSYLDVFYLVPPGRGPDAQRMVGEGLPRFIRALEGADIGRAVLVSSSAVYGDRGGAVVDADTPAAAADERGRVLLEAERIWLQCPLPAGVLRLAGIYGPGRVIGLQGICAGAPIGGDLDAFLNLIHVEDAAELLLRMAGSAGAASIELGCDGAPVTRAEYYGWLAARLGLPAPTAAVQDGGGTTLRRRGAGSRRCDNAVTCRRTGWRPHYPDFRAGLAGLPGDVARRDKKSVPAG